MKNKFFIIFFVFVSFGTIYAQNDYKGIYEEAVNKINGENYLEAIRLLQLIQDIDDYMVFYSLGYCYYVIENDTLARVNLKRSIELNGNFLKSRALLGNLYFYIDEFDAAQKEYLRCIEIDKTDYRTYFFLGKIHEIKNNLDTAINYYFEGLKYNNRDFNINYALANVYFDSDDYINAKKYFEICDNINNQLYPVVNCLIRIKHRENNLKNIDELKQRLRTIKQNSDDERIKSLTRFTIDTFIYKDFKIFAEETFDLSGTLYYHWVFRILDNNDNFIKNVNLESSLVLRELGTAFIIGIDIFEKNRRIHRTTGIGFSALPEYSVMKNMVIKEIEEGLPVSATGIYPYKD